MEPNQDTSRLQDVDVPIASIVDSPRSAMANDVSVAAARPPKPLDFDDFYREHAPPIGRALEVTLGDTELAEDALNEAMARALQRWTRVSRFDNAPGWVYRVAMNWALSWMRRRRRERERPATTRTVSTELQPADQELAAALSALSLDHRAVVVCRYLLDWSTAQTAQALSIAEGTVKSRLARALHAIRRTLEVQP